MVKVHAVQANPHGLFRDLEHSRQSGRAWLLLIGVPNELGGHEDFRCQPVGLGFVWPA